MTDAPSAQTEDRPAPWTSAGYRKALAQWDVRYTRASVKPNAATLKMGTMALERQLDAAAHAIDGNDTKAALVIPAVGVIIGIVGPLVPDKALQEPFPIPWTLAAAGLSAAVCALLAVVALWPRPRSNGADVRQLVVGMASPIDQHAWDYFKSLAFAAELAGNIANSKGKLLSWCFAAGGLSVVLLLAFVFAGGLQP